MDYLSNSIRKNCNPCISASSIYQPRTSVVWTSFIACFALRLGRYPIRTILKKRFEQWLHHQSTCLLYYSVSNGWYSQWTHLSIRLRNVNSFLSGFGRYEFALSFSESSLRNGSTLSDSISHRDTLSIPDSPPLAFILLTRPATIFRTGIFGRKAHESALSAFVWLPDRAQGFHSRDLKKCVVGFTACTLTYLRTFALLKKRSLPEQSFTVFIIGTITSSDFSQNINQNFAFTYIRPYTVLCYHDPVRSPLLHTSLSQHSASPTPEDSSNL